MPLIHFPFDGLVAGLDEAGRGCLAGPVSTAAVILPKDFFHKDLNDSKKLTEKKRIELAKIIKKEAVSYSVSHVSEEKIDEINILQAAIFGMHQSVKELKIQPEKLIIDGNYFKPFKDIPHECVVKGDGKFLSIAAASILAKTERDFLMKELDKEFPFYGWKKNKGYPTKAHREAIADYGITVYHRRSFKLLK